MNTTEILLFYIFISMFLSGLITWVFIAKLKNTKRQISAKGYIKENSFFLKNRRDSYLYSRTTKTRIQNNNSGSSRGGSRGGRRGGGHRGGHRGGGRGGRR